MKHYENLYFFKDDPKVVRKYLNDFLLFQIYSPEVIRQAYVRWPELNWSFRDNTPEDIKELIYKSPLFSQNKLKSRLNELQIKRAVAILKGYQACDVPLTNNPEIPQNRYNLLSRKGEKALNILNQALENNTFTDKMSQLALSASHKFLADEAHYISFSITKEKAKSLIFPFKNKKDGKPLYDFPTIQITQGCLNHCSHCDSRATTKIAHMPWPLFRYLYKSLNKYYRHFPQNETGFYFSSFFADSDMLDYYDPISKADSGDVGLFISDEKGYCQYLTRGVKNNQNKLALAKALYSNQPVGISFVDTPAENKAKNLTLLNNTLEVVESVSDRLQDPYIMHLHLKSGPTVAEDIFRGYPSEKAVIYALGRAKDFPINEVEHHPDNRFLPKFTFTPDGAIYLQEVQDGEIQKNKVNHLFKNEIGPKITPLRLLWHQFRLKGK